MDELPDALQTLATAALAEMQADPRHRLLPRRRQALYAALAAAPRLSAAPHWLAVLAAERVLPLFRVRCPEDELPPALLAAAIGVLEGQGDADTAAELEARGYRASKNAWGYEGDELPWPVGLAADAALRALREARGYRPLTNLDAYRSQGTVALQPGPAAGPPLPAPTPGEEALNDETLCRMEDGDTASIAAVAAASSDFGPTCDPERLQAFWTWWLQEALPGAVAAARRGRRA
jgi:hypothetical protein